MVQPLSSTPGYIDPSKMHQRFQQESPLSAPDESVNQDNQEGLGEVAPVEMEEGVSSETAGSIPTPTPSPAEGLTPETGSITPTPPSQIVADIPQVSLLETLGAEPTDEDDIALETYALRTALSETPRTKQPESVLARLTRDPGQVVRQAEPQTIEQGAWKPTRVRYAERAQGVSSSLLDVVSLAEKYLPEGFELQVGHQGGRRTQAEQDALVKKGVSKTRRSYHMTGRAIDLQPIVGGKNRFDSHDMKYWGPVRDAMKRASAELGIPVEWGGDWRGSWDKPHWQLPKNWEPATS